MKATALLLVLMTILVAGCMSAPRVVTDATEIPDGRYVPDPKKTWYAGATLEVRGTHFTYESFTDVLPEVAVPPVTGTIRKEGERYIFERSGSIWAVWILGHSRGRPVLWSLEGFERWKASGTIEPLDVLYLEKEPNKAPEPTPTAVTPRASSRMIKMKRSNVDRHVARGAPAAVVAHL